MIERACKSSTDQKIKLLIFQKLSDPFLTHFFTDTGVKDFNRPTVDRAADRSDPISISRSFVRESAQKV
jgi:hypothetical protein